MKEAVIVSTARTPIGKAYRGAFNNLESPTLASYAIKAAVERTAAGQEAGKFDDEIVAVKATKMILDKATGEVSYAETELAQDEGNRPGTTLEGL